MQQAVNILYVAFPVIKHQPEAAGIHPTIMQQDTTNCLTIENIHYGDLRFRT